MVATFDIETDGLYYEATTIHSIAIKLDDNPTEVYTSRPIAGSAGSIEDGLALLKGVTLVAHNGINFDIPVIKKLYGIDLYKDNNVFDTMIVSKLKYPNLLLVDSNRKTMPNNLKGSHSLKAWGYRLRLLKGEMPSEDWSKLTTEMVEYNRQDVEVTYKLYNYLNEKGLPPAEAIRIEQEFAKIIARQEHYGWKFDVKKAEQLHIELIQEMEEAEAKLFEVFKPLQVWTPKPYPLKPYKQDGSKSQVLINQENLGCHYNDDMEWGYYQETIFNPGSGKHIHMWVEHLYGKQNWELTEKGTPKTGADDITKLFSDKEWAKPLLHYFNVKKLLGQLAEGNNAWLKLVKDDGRIHGSVDTLGAVSRRCTHRNPNMAQVPSARAFKGKECRSLFTSEDNKILVGCDMSGLELRVFSHFLARYDGGRYADVILKEDIHTFNQKAFGVPTRDIAKTTIYGTLYGAGDEKVGLIVGKGRQAGKRIKDNFKKNVPAYARLLEAVDKAVTDNGTLLALDGNPYYIRSSHSALNTLLQGAGAILCKQWLIETDKKLQELGYTNSWDSDAPQYEFVANVHDEFTTECDLDIADTIAKVKEECCNKAGEYFNLRIRLDGEAKVAKDWYGIH